MGRPKIFEKTPESNCCILNSMPLKDNKKYLYFGTSSSISQNRKDIYNSKNSIATLITDSDEQYQICKIGITRNIEQRLIYFTSEIPDFKFIKSWRIRYPKTLENFIVEDHYKDDISTYGSEWMWLGEKQVQQIIEEIEWYINNTYVRYKHGYTLLFRIP
mgnify:CR=1 FL=1